MSSSADRSTPVLPGALAGYLRTGIGRVEGWLSPSTAVYLGSLEALQRNRGLAGDVAEIGIHHGKSFLALTLGLPAGSRAVAIDVFEDQAANVDRSGRGDRAVFEHNLAEHGVTAAVEVIRASSLSLWDLGFVDGGCRFRLFSIDGGHTVEITANDLRIAEQVTVDEGIVILDDLLNPHWLGVVTGLFHYWAEGGTLIPAVVVPDKLFLARSAEQAKACRELMASTFGVALEKRNVPFGDHGVDLYGEFPWTVVDESGVSGELCVPASLSHSAAGATTTVPPEYLVQLEARTRSLERLVRGYETPLAKRVLARMPWLARRVRPLAARLRGRRSE